MMQVGKIEQLTDKPDWSYLFEGLEGVADRVESNRVDWQRKFDALYAALYETLDDATRDRVLARAKELEVEQDDDESELTP
jgi:hypothetical protein